MASVGRLAMAGSLVAGKLAQSAVEVASGAVRFRGRRPMTDPARPFEELLAEAVRDQPGSIRLRHFRTSGGVPPAVSLLAVEPDGTAVRSYDSTFPPPAK